MEVKILIGILGSCVNAVAMKTQVDCFLWSSPVTFFQFHGNAIGLQDPGGAANTGCSEKLRETRACLWTHPGIINDGLEGSTQAENDASETSGLVICVCKLA